MQDFSLSEPSLLGQQVLVSASINLGSILALPDCRTMNYTTGALDKCVAFRQQFLLIWWLNFIMCSLSLTLSYDYRHSVIRSLVVFILTVWEFTFCLESPGQSKDPIMPCFVLLLRPMIFGLLMLDIMLDVDFRHCIKSVYTHMIQELVFSFLEFFKNYFDVIENIPGLWQITNSLGEISRCSSCTNL